MPSSASLGGFALLFRQKNSDEVREKLQAAWDTRKDSVHRQPARAVDKVQPQASKAEAKVQAEAPANEPQGKAEAPAAEPEVEQQVQVEASPAEASTVIDTKSPEEKKARTAVAIALERKLRRQRMSKIQLKIQRADRKSVV